jgi:Plasmid pRiA4b ORF-3-like protein
MASIRPASIGPFGSLTAGGEILKLPVSEFRYFGDGWEHTIEIEDLVVPSTEGKWIQCVAGENACPPEDVKELSA